MAFNLQIRFSEASSAGVLNEEANNHSIQPHLSHSVALPHFRCSKTPSELPAVEARFVVFTISFHVANETAGCVRISGPTLGHRLA